MYFILIAVHVVSCLFLVVTILLQAGRGGGLTEVFSGQTQSVLGTQAPHVLKRATTISAVMFLSLSLILGIYTSRRSRSIFQQMNLPANTAAMPVSAKDMGSPVEPAGSTGTDVQGAPVTSDVEGTDVAE